MFDDIFSIQIQKVFTAGLNFRKLEKTSTFEWKWNRMKKIEYPFRNMIFVREIRALLGLYRSEKSIG